MKKQLLIAGGTGMIGSELQRVARSANWDVSILSRQAGANRIKWDPKKGTIELPSKMTYDAIINLAGASLNSGRWTEITKKEIYNSRLMAARTLENYLFDGRLATKCYLGASAVGIYGDQRTKEVNEKTPVNPSDWFTKTVDDWEAAHHRMEALDIRTIILRTGMVLSREGGALTEILKPTRFGIITFFGNGRQFWSWIHIHDLARMMLYCCDHNDLKGIFLATAPEPVTNKNFTRRINYNLPTRKMIIGVPKAVLVLMLGEMHRILFDSCNATPKKIMKHGFQFKYPTLDTAARDLVSKKMS